MANQVNPAPPAGEEEEVSWEDAFADAAQGPGADGAPDPAGAAGDSLAAARSAMRDAAGERPAGAVDLDFLLDIQLNVTVEIGRKKIAISDLLQLQQGSVIDLPKTVGEPFEVYVNGKLMAFGEIVVVNEKFGIRLTDVIDPQERLEKLA